MFTYLSRLAFSLAVMVAAFAPCAAQTVIESEEYVVYSALLNSIYADSAEVTLTISHITDSNNFNSKSFAPLLKKTALLDLSILSDFNFRNRMPSKIEDRFNVDKKINLVEEKTVDSITYSGLSQKELLEEKGWKEFRQRYESSQFLYLSRVGFNQKQTRAFLLLGYQSGWLGGEGNYYILEKKRSQWVIKKRIHAWIS